MTATSQPDAETLSRIASDLLGRDIAEIAVVGTVGDGAAAAVVACVVASKVSAPGFRRSRCS